MCFVAIQALDNPLHHGQTPTLTALKTVPDFNYGGGLQIGEASHYSQYCAQAHVHENLTQVVLTMDIERNGSKAEIVWDTGATLCVTHCQSDFTKPPTKTPVTHVLKGLAKGLSIEAVGEVSWTCTADDGTDYTVLAPAYYVPQSERRLLSPQAFLQKEYHNNGTEMTARQTWKGIYLDCPDGRCVSMPYNQKNNLPTLYVGLNPPRGSTSRTKPMCPRRDELEPHGRAERTTALALPSRTLKLGEHSATPSDWRAGTFSNYTGCS
jgi:hypothetical protein